MNKEQRVKYLKDIENQYDIEGIHRGLEALSKDVAREILEEMNSERIHMNVNLRNCQEDYIADYLEYLWDISKPSFWKHVIESLNTTVGLLWSDNMFYMRVLCDHRLPLDVWDAIMSFALDAEQGSDIDAIGYVVRSQCEKFGMEDSFRSYIQKCPLNLITENNRRLNDILSTTCKYSFL